MPVEHSCALVPRVSLAEWAALGNKKFRFGRHAVFSREHGSGSAAPLLLIHGFPTASWDWEAIWGSLSKRYRVIAADMLGFGLSSKPANFAYSIAAQANLQEALLRHHGVTDYHLLAHDYGDTVAQELLARQAEGGDRPRLLSAAFLNGGLFHETHRPLLMQRLLISPIGPLLAKLTSYGRFSKSMRRIFGAETQPSDAHLHGFWLLVTREGGLRLLPKLIRYMQERRQFRARWVGALERATVPLKLIVGGADPISGTHMADRYRALVPNADVTELPGIGHYPQLEAPEEVVEAYLAFRSSALAAQPEV